MKRWCISLVHFGLLISGHPYTYSRQFSLTAVNNSHLPILVQTQRVFNLIVGIHDGLNRSLKAENEKDHEKRHEENTPRVVLNHHVVSCTKSFRTYRVQIMCVLFKRCYFLSLFSDLWLVICFWFTLYFIIAITFYFLACFDWLGRIRWFCLWEAETSYLTWRHYPILIDNYS